MLWHCLKSRQPPTQNLGNETLETWKDLTSLDPPRKHEHATIERLMASGSETTFTSWWGQWWMSVGFPAEPYIETYTLHICISIFIHIIGKISPDRNFKICPLRSQTACARLPLASSWRYILSLLVVMHKYPQCQCGESGLKCCKTVENGSRLLIMA